MLVHAGGGKPGQHRKVSFFFCVFYKYQSFLKSKARLKIRRAGRFSIW
jgi:hypothetical protein